MPSTTMTPTAEQQTQALLNEPAGAPPPGVMPNVNDPSTINRYIILVLVLGLTCSTLAIFLRTYTKIFLMRTRAYEDSKSQLPHFLLHTAVTDIGRRCHRGMGKEELLKSSFQRSATDGG